MRVLLDECCPRPLRSAISQADVFTVEMAKLRGFENGDLIAAAEKSFDVLITADKNLRYQQNLSNRSIAIIELPFNSWKRLKLILPELQMALANIKPGDYLEIPATPKLL